MKKLSTIVVFLLFVLTPCTVLAQGLDLFDAEVLADGSLLVTHLNSFHNCCAPIAHETVIDGFTLQITEIEPFINGCWCVCYFDVEVTIEDLPPGLYTIEYIWDSNENIYIEEWNTEVWTIEMPDFSPPQNPGFQSLISECHGGHSVPVQGIRFESLKSYYR